MITLSMIIIKQVKVIIFADCESFIAITAYTEISVKFTEILWYHYFNS